MPSFTDSTGRRYTIKAEGAEGAGGEGVTIGGKTPEGGGSSGVAALPFDLSGFFPEFAPVDFNSIKFPKIDPADFNFTDPQQFAKNFGASNTQQFTQNFKTARDVSLQALDAELQGLKAFAPAATALKRELTSADNLFNQEQRSRQVRSVLPEAEGDLGAQRRRALTYAEGRLPDEQTDRAFELGIRSRAADRAQFSGIGPRSLQAQKTSDLMSAEDRFKVAQYGEGLYGQNLSTRANLFLAPTSYSDAGQQIKVTPEVGAGRLAFQAADMLNAKTLLSPETALTSTINQEQFKTNLDQRTNEFNANGTFSADQFNSQGTLQADMFNSSGAFAAGLGLFNYQAGLAAQFQGANQANLNATLEAQTAGQGAGTFDAGIANGQAAQTIQSVASGTGIIPSAVNSIANALNPPASISSGGQAGITSADIASAPSGEFEVAQIESGDIPETDLLGSINSSGPDLSTPSALKFAPGVQAPTGYTPIANNPDGTYSAVRTADYRSDLENFAKFANVPSSGVSIQPMATADRALANSTGLSYVPIRGFQQVALSSSGRPVYSTPDAAANGDFLLGRDNVNGLGLSLALLGVEDPEVFDEVGSIAEVVSNPEFLTKLDKLHAERGDEAVAQAIINKIGSGGATDSDSQQLAAGALRTGQFWGGLSPAQKSLALSSLAGPALNKKAGRILGNDPVAGTENAVAGPLKISDATNLTAQGKNGFALARNWTQLSAVADIVGGVKDPRQVANLSENIGLLGYGPQGSSVPVTEPEKLKRARPAPELGVGASIFKGKGDLPKHYEAVTQLPDGRIVGMPSNLVHTSPLGNGKNKALAFEKSKQISSRTHLAQRAWKQSPSRSLVRGSAGGSAVVSGLELMTKSNPSLFGSIAAYSLFNETMGG